MDKFRNIILLVVFYKICDRNNIMLGLFILMFINGGKMRKKY